MVFGFDGANPKIPFRWDPTGPSRVGVIWDRTNRSSLGIFDNQAMKQGPVAEVELPVRVPFGFHGLWVDEDQL